MTGLDTNVLVRYIMQDDPKQSPMALTAQLAAPLGDRLHTGQVVLRIEPTRHGVDVLALNTATASSKRIGASSGQSAGVGR